VISGAFINFLLHNHFITEKIYKKKSGEAKDSAIFPFFILLHKRANPILPPYLHPHLRARTQTYTPPLPSPSPGGSIRPYLFPPPMACQDLSKKFHYNTKRCNYKTNSSESIKRHQYADV
jgi:hypothetical protein